MNPIVATPESPSATVWAQARHKAEEGRELARSLPALLREVLERAPDGQRGVALTAMLVCVAMLLGDTDSRWAGVWIALQVGGGCAWMALPAAVGWSRSAISRFGALMLVAGLVGVIGLTGIAPDNGEFRQAVRQGLLIASLIAVAASSIMVFGSSRHGRLPGALVLPFSAALGVTGGAALVILGVTAWPGLHDRAERLAIAMAASFGVWLLAFLCNRFEVSCAYQGAGRLLGLRNGMIRLGALVGGVAVAQLAVSALEATAWRAAIGTPLEGMASHMGVVAGAVFGLAAAGAGLALPRLLGRLQLSGRIGPGAGGEIGWFSGGMLVVVSVFWLSTAMTTQMAALIRIGPLLHDVPVYFGDRDAATFLVAVACLAVVVHGAVRILLGRPTAVTGPTLWLVLPSDSAVRHGLKAANALARRWSDGPVVLLAPATAASRVRGAQLRLAEAAGSGGELFLPSALDAKVWWSCSLSATGGGALRLREVYAGAEAARALVCGAGADARMLVLADGPLADGWGAVMDALPAGAERISRREPMDVGWQALDFAARVARARLVDDFLLRHRPAPRPVRRVLILHAPADQALAERLADVLAEAAGKRDADVVATLFEPSTTASRALAWSGGTWVTLLALLSRFSQRGELGRLGQLAWWFVPRSAADARGMRIDLVVIESEWDEAGVPAAQGLERVADSVISLKPAIERRDRPGLYPPEAYGQVIHLPAPSALTQSLGALARRLLAEPEGIDALGASPSSAEPGLKTRR